jgi:hypothetical protein
MDEHLVLAIFLAISLVLLLGGFWLCRAVTIAAAPLMQRLCLRLRQRAVAQREARYGHLNVFDRIVEEACDIALRRRRAWQAGLVLLLLSLFDRELTPSHHPPPLINPGTQSRHRGDRILSCSDARRSSQLNVPVAASFMLASGRCARVTPR